MRARRNVALIVIFGLTVASAAGLGLAVQAFRTSASSAQSPGAGLECGHWAVLRSCELLGIPLSAKRVRDMMPAGPRGHSLKDLADTLHVLGLETKARSETFETFLEQEGVRIVHISKPDHFIVILRTGSKGVSFFDDRGRHQHMSVETLKSRWSGSLLHVQRPARNSNSQPTARDSSVTGPRIQFETLFRDKGDIPIVTAHHRAIASKNPRKTRIRGF